MTCFRCFFITYDEYDICFVANKNEDNSLYESVTFAESADGASHDEGSLTHRGGNELDTFNKLCNKRSASEQIFLGCDCNSA